MRPSGSPKTVAASSNETLCLARFAAAFCGSHSRSNANSHYTRRSREARLQRGLPTAEHRLGKLKRAPPIWYGMDGWTLCRISIMGRKCRFTANCTSSLQRGFARASWGRVSGCQPLANPGNRFIGEFALRRHLHAGFIAEGLEDQALIGIGGRAERTVCRGLANAFDRAEIQASAPEFCVVAALTLFREERTRVLLEEFGIVGSEQRCYSE